jgi:hypothetical protein
LAKNTIFFYYSVKNAQNSVCPDQILSDHKNVRGQTGKGADLTLFDGTFNAYVAG